MEPQRGFTFVEMVVTLAIMGVLASVAIPLVQLDAQRRRETELRSALIDIRSALDAFKRASDQGRIALRPGDSGYPRSLDELWEGVTDQRSPTAQKIYFLRSLPRDPMNSDPALAAAHTWSLRSYASPPDAPAEGADVFDIRSRSSQLGLNGIAYSDW
jgi:general secretion pathway protein G